MTDAIPLARANFVVYEIAFSCRDFSGNAIEKLNLQIHEHFLKEKFHIRFERLETKAI